MCLHSAYEAGGVVYVRALGGPAGPVIVSNACSNSDAGDGGNTRDVAAESRRDDRDLVWTHSADRR
jgi:hypothetical protein